MVVVVIVGVALLVLSTPNVQNQSARTHPLIISPATPVFSGVPENVSMLIVPGQITTSSFPIVVLHQFNLTFGYLNIMNVTNTTPNGTSIYSSVLGHQVKLSSKTIDGIPDNPFVEVSNGTILVNVGVSVPQGTEAGSYWFLFILKAYGAPNNTQLLYADAIRVILNVQ